MKQYIVDAFAERVFSGNPAAVCLVDTWPSDDLMQQIARENNLSETAFVRPLSAHYGLRWFTPGGEIDLCGHATLAAAHVILTELGKATSPVVFETLSGQLQVTKQDSLYQLDFPAYDLQPQLITDEIVAVLGLRPKEVWLGRDLLCIFEDEEQVKNFQPDFDKIKSLQGLLLHISAKGHEVDCVSRSFAPKLAVAEDPVCGSGHCHIIPYWAKRLDKMDLVAYQASERGGILYCRQEGKRIRLGGKAVTFARSELLLNGRS